MINLIGTMPINYNCYFADCCLHIQDEEHLLKNSRLSGFLDETPYRSEIKLRVTSGDFDTYKQLEAVSDSSGVIVSKTDDGGWLFSSDDTKNPCKIAVSQDYAGMRCYIPRSEDESRLSENFLQLLRIAAECHLSRYSGVSIHAACVCLDEKAVLFSAPSGMGKSTQASLWEKSLGARIINGDRPFLRFSSDCVRAFGVPWDGKEQIFLQDNYPVKAIVEVRQAKSNYLRKMSENQAFRLLMRQCFIPMWDDEAKFFAVKTIKSIVHAVPFYRLFCLPEEGAAQLLSSVLFKEQVSLVKEVRTDMKIIEGFILKNVIDEWIVMPTGNNIKNFEGAIVLNDVSAFVWEKLENAISREDILQAILEEYDISEQKAAADLDDFLGQLEELGLLKKD